MTCDCWPSWCCRCCCCGGGPREEGVPRPVPEEEQEDGGGEQERLHQETARLGGHRGGIGGLRGAGEVVAHVAEELREAVRAVAGVHRVDPHGRRGTAEGYQLRRAYQGSHPRNQLRIRREDRVGQGGNTDALSLPTLHYPSYLPPSNGVTLLPSSPLPDWVDIWFGDGGHIDGLQDALQRLEVGVLHPREGGVQRLCSHQPVGPAAPGAALGAGIGGDLLKPALPSVVRLRGQPEMAGEIRVHQHHRVPVHVDPPPRLLHHSGYLPPHRETHHPYCKILTQLRSSSSPNCTFTSPYRMHVTALCEQIDNTARVWFLALFLSIIATGILELRWSGVSIQDWWSNEQFWVIGGVDTNFTVTAKAAEDSEFGELYLFKWTTLLLPPTTLIILNMVGVVAGVSDAINNGYGSWGASVREALLFLLGHRPSVSVLEGVDTKTIVVLWSILLASIFSLVWVRIDPFFPKQQGPVLKQCGVEC
ncbi:hypothetical protein GW17_00004328 [Ensete ventricosum]|nr:hypothetical protein GW17_00004328 [Ensete ventricosum]RZR75794.1 hypothetical protein BHM03_00000280 [Ensete ventricosum]